MNTNMKLLENILEQIFEESDWGDYNENETGVRILRDWQMTIILIHIIVKKLISTASNIQNMVNK